MAVSAGSVAIETGKVEADALDVVVVAVETGRVADDAFDVVVVALWAVAVETAEVGAAVV